MKKLFTLLTTLSVGFSAMAIVPTTDPAPLRINSNLDVELPQQPDPSKIDHTFRPMQVDKTQVHSLKTRATEDAYCFIEGNIFEDSSSEYMLPASDGTFTLSPGVTNTGRFYIVYNSGEENSNQIIYASTDGLTELDTPLECTPYGNYYFNINKGDYTFTFDPEKQTLLITGEAFPPDYYLSGYFNDNVRGDENYKFTKVDDGSGNYTLSINGTITTYFIIDTGSLSLYYGGGETEYIEMGVPYQTVKNSGSYIATDDLQSINDPTFTFNPETGILLVDGTLVEAEYTYLIYSNLNGYWATEEMTEQEDGNWTYKPGNSNNSTSQFELIQVLKGTDLYLHYIFSEEYNYLSIGEPVQCGYSGSWFRTYPGDYELVFNPNTMTLVVNGELAPMEYYLYVSELANNFTLTETQEGSGMFEFANMAYLPSGYYIWTNYNTYYSSNNDYLVANQPYETSMMADYYNGNIYNSDNDNIYNATVSLNVLTGELLVTGEAAAPEPVYALFCNFLSEPFHGYDPSSEANLWKTANLILEGTWFADDYWTEIQSPEIVLNNEKISIHTPEGMGYQQWQGQVHILTDIEVSADKSYDFSCYINSPVDSNVTVKVQKNGDDTVFFVDERLYFKAGGDVFYFTDLRGFDGQLSLVFDFAGYPDTDFEITDIVFQQHDEEITTNQPWELLPLNRIGDIYTLEKEIKIFDGEFSVIKYDARIDLVSNYYWFYGADYYQYPIAIGEPTQCYRYSSNYPFFIEAGDYNFSFSPDSKKIVVYNSETEINSGYLSSRGWYEGADYVVGDFDIISINMPEGNLDYTVYYKPIDAENYDSFEVDNTNFSLDIRNLIPETSYSYEVYVVATAEDGQEYITDTYQFSFTTNSVYLDFYIYRVSNTESSIIMEYTCYNNLGGDNEYSIAYTLSAEGEENQEVQFITLDGTSGEFSFEGLKPNTWYSGSLQFVANVDEVNYYSNIRYYEIRTAETSAIEVIGNDNAEVKYYNLSGQEVKHPSGGIFIEVKGSQVRKVLIK